MFSIVIIAVIITQLVAQLKKLGQIIAIDTNKSYYESWTKANSTFCGKFPGTVKATFNCGTKSKYSYNSKKAYSEDDINEQIDFY